MISLLGGIGAEYQRREDDRLYGGGVAGGLPFLFGSRPENRPQRNQLADMLTGKYQDRKRRERKAGQALVEYLANFGRG